MTPQQMWHIRMMCLFGLFIGGSPLLPLLPFAIYRICLFEKILGIPCPGCGICSSIHALLNGNWQQAISYNPCGPFVFITCIVLVSYFTYACLTRQCLHWADEIYIFKLINVLTTCLLSLQWGYRILNY